MDFTFQASAQDVLTKPEEALFRASVQLAQHTKQLRGSVVGKRMDEFRGTIETCHGDRIRLKVDDGTHKDVPLTQRRATQLVQHALTTRK